MRILLLLERDELSVAELQEILMRGQSQISTQLAQLKQAGLVAHRRTGKNTFYRIKPAAAVEEEARVRLLELLRVAAAEIPEVKDDRAALELVLTKRQDKMRTYFDALAGKFGREYLPGRSWKGLAEVLLQLMPPGVVADLGAGEGTFSQLLARSAEHVIAVDNSEKMVEFGSRLAREHGWRNLDFRLGDMEAVPIESEKVDLAFFSQSLHHAQHPAQAVQEASRILKPGGRVAILDLVKHTFEQARDLYADVWLGFTEVELRAFLHEAGFMGIATSKVDRESIHPHFETVCAIAHKPLRQTY